MINLDQDFVLSGESYKNTRSRAYRVYIAYQVHSAVLNGVTVKFQVLFMLGVSW